MYVIQHCFMCRPSDSFVSEDARVELRTVAALALTARRSNHLARSHPHLARFHPLNHQLQHVLKDISFYSRGMCWGNSYTSSYGSYQQECHACVAGLQGTLWHRIHDLPVVRHTRYYSCARSCRTYQQTTVRVARPTSSWGTFSQT
jgi:hypothetical protein